MFGLRKRQTTTDIYGAPLVLRSAEGAPFYTFSSEVSNIFRHMLTGLSSNAALPARLSVISALRGEGVTYTALGLATTIANDTAARVCAVELNWWSPGMLLQLSQSADAGVKQKRFKRASKTADAAATISTALSGAPGLSDVLAGTVEIDAALIQTHLPNLSVLPAGVIPVAQRPVAARSSALKDCITDLSQRFDHVILDIPAILVTSDAIVLAGLGNACCLVIRQGVTSTSQVQAALDDVKHMPMLGVVLNGVDIQTPRWIRNLLN